MVRRFQYPAFATNSEALTDPEVTTLDRWWQPLSGPVRLSRGALYATALAASGAVFVGEPSDFAAAETVTVDKWLQPLSEPVRVKPGLLAANQPSFTIDAEALTQPEAAQLDKWFAPFSEPIQLPPRDHAALYAGGLYQGEPGDFGVVETVTLDKWLAPLSVPVLPKAPVAQQQAFTTDLESLTQAEVTTPDKWWQALATPVRVSQANLTASALAASGNIFVGEPGDFPVAETVTLDKWYSPFSVPVLPRVPVAYQLAFAVDANALTQPEATQLDKWYTNLSEPVRQTPYSLAALVSGGLHQGDPSGFTAVAIGAPDQRTITVTGQGRTISVASRGGAIEVDE